MGTMLSAPASDPGSSAAGANMRGPRKAAILLMTLGEVYAKPLLRDLRPADLQRVTEEIARIGEVTREEQAEVLLNFYHLQQTQDFMLRGGPEHAQRLLSEAVGKQRAEDLVREVAGVTGQVQADLAELQKMDPAQLSKFLDGEHPQTVALVLAHLNPKRGSVVLMQLREGLRVEAIRRLAEMRQFSPEMAQKVANILYTRIHALGSQGRQNYAGFRAVADLLNRLDQGASKSILEQIEGNEPGLAVNIRNLMFTFDDLLTVQPNSIRELVGAADKKILALALKTADENLKAHLFRAMSSRAVEMLQEDMESMGPVRSKDVAQSQQELLALARRLESQGKMVLKVEVDGDA